MANVQYYDVILKPVVTEKSMDLMSDKKYTFYVHYCRTGRGRAYAEGAPGC